MHSTFASTGNDFDWQRIVTENIGGLLASSAYTDEPLSRNKLSERILLLCIEKQASVYELARQLGLRYEPLNRLANGERLIPIISLIEICSALKTSLSSFLALDSLMDSSELLNQVANYSITTKGRTHVQRKHLTPKQKRQLLQDALTENPPPSNYEIAKRNGYKRSNPLQIPETLDLYNQINICYATYLD